MAAHLSKRCAPAHILRSTTSARSRLRRAGGPTESRRLSHQIGIDLNPYSSVSDHVLAPTVTIHVFGQLRAHLCDTTAHVSSVRARDRAELTADCRRATRETRTAFVKLQQDSLSNPWPGPLIKLWRARHPPLGERIEFSNDYRPWREGAPLRYADRFRN